MTKMDYFYIGLGFLSLGIILLMILPDNKPPRIIEMIATSIWGFVLLYLFIKS